MKLQLLIKTKILKKKAFLTASEVASLTFAQNLVSVCYMGESVQDLSWIQDFEADFPKKVSLKMLN